LINAWTLCCSICEVIILLYKIIWLSTNTMDNRTRSFSWTQKHSKR
jgi:hypothetical protein